MRRRWITLMWSVILALCFASCTSAVTYQINWYSINSGGGLATGTSYAVNCSIGQSTAGFVQSVNLLHWIGFWAGESPTPKPIDNLADVKLEPDGTLVSVAGKIVTSDSGDFQSFFYLEEANRSSGIRVAASPSSIPGLLRNKIVNVIGTMGTTAAGERQLIGPMVVIGATASPIRPVGMNNMWVGGGDLGDPDLGAGQWGVTGGTGLNNIGLLIATWGRVTAKGTGYMVIDDGSGTPVTVDTTTLVSTPALNSYVSVIGISSLTKPGADRLRTVLPRNDADWRNQ